MNYKGLQKRLTGLGLTRSALTKELGLSSRTVAKIGKGEELSKGVLGKIAGFLDCDVDDLVEADTPSSLLEILNDERSHRIPGGIYHELQISMTYNSNHIEGSKLSEDQTRMIFETQTIGLGGSVPVNDIIETVNHFRAVDYCIDHATEPLTEAMIKELHRILKQGSGDSSLGWFAVGDYKKRPNVVGGRDTAAPADVPGMMQELLGRYNSSKSHDFREIVEFHCRFERIHPFQDGNGRTGRLIVLKECLKNGIVPFIIDDELKLYYYRGLLEFDREPGYLIDTCLAAQDKMKKQLDRFEIPYLS